MKNWILAGVALMGGAGFMLGGCASTTEPLEEEVAPEVTVQTEEGNVTPQKNSRGQCCWGHCNNSNAFVKVNVTQNCRDRIVDSCHNAGQLFKGNGDAWWGTCP